MIRLAAALALLGLAAPSGAFAHGDAVPVSRLSSAWEAAPLPIAGGLVALALFAQAFARLRRRGRTDHAGWGRAALYVGGVAVITLALVSPLDAVGDEYLLFAHMGQHLLIGDVGPALVLLAVRGPLTFFLLPPSVLRALAPIRPLRSFLGLLLRPKVAFCLWVATMAAWHVPVCYDYALAHPRVHDLEHLSFLVAGFLAWAQLIDPARRGALSVPSGRVLYAACLFAAGHVVVHPILFGGGALYKPYVRQDERLLGLSPLADQHWAGIVMTVDQVLTLGTLCLVLLWPHMRKRPEPVVGG
jgi:cytochrome c oxidase assembly factor CtaG